MAKKTIRKVASKKSKSPPAPVQTTASPLTTEQVSSIPVVVQVETWETSFERVVELHKNLSSMMKQLKLSR